MDIEISKYPQNKRERLERCECGFQAGGKADNAIQCNTMPTETRWGQGSGRTMGLPPIVRPWCSAGASGQWRPAQKNSQRHGTGRVLARAGGRLARLMPPGGQCGFRSS